MKFCQMLVCCMTNISNMSLTQCWILETRSRPFYDFIKMIIQQDLDIFLIIVFISFLKEHKNTKYIYKYKITQKLVKLKEEKNCEISEFLNRKQSHLQDPCNIQDGNLPDINSPRPKAIKRCCEGSGRTQISLEYDK